MAVAAKRSVFFNRKWIMQTANTYLFENDHPACVMFLLLIFEICINLVVINNRSYTEIDWRAYMEEVEGVVNGTFDYTQLRGDTGPLVYPAGFVYIYTVLYYLTAHGSNILIAQYIFMVIYITNLIIVFDIYARLKMVPSYVFVLMCCASYRIHSIYILRLFNDPIAMLFLYGAVDLFMRGRWTLGCVMFSLGVSVKMNLLLFSPALLYLLVCTHGAIGTALHLFYCGAIQIILALPFLFVNPTGYMTRSFDLGRQFFYEWTVNWRFLPETVFLSRYFHAFLLFLHVATLVSFAIYKWLPLNNLRQRLKKGENSALLPHQIAWCLCTSNLIGVTFSRTLHYQFYVWYFHTLHYLTWSTSLPTMIRLLLLGVIELAWNTYPSTSYSSVALLFSHIILLASLWTSDGGRHIHKYTVNIYNKLS